MKDKVIRVTLEGLTKDGVYKSLGSVDVFIRKDSLWKKFRVIRKTFYLEVKGED